jgi:hypothetical protein
MTIINIKEEEQPEQEFKQRVKWDWNNKSRQSFLDNGFTADKIPRHVAGVDIQVKEFLSKVDHKGKFVPVRSVTRIVRTKAIDWEDKYHKDKQFLYWFEDWSGKDWLGRDIAPVTDHLQGVYDKVIMEDIVNDFGDVEGSKFKETRKVHYIPFSKKAVDEIISTSNNTDKNNIKFIFKGNQMRTGDFTYEQFCNSTWDEMEEISRIAGGPKMFEHWNKFDVRTRQENFKKYQQVG